MAGPSKPCVFHPSAGSTPGAVRTIPLTVAADVDLTDPAGPTGGYCARALLIGDTGGAVSFYDCVGGAVQTVKVTAYQRFDQNVSVVALTGTTATVYAQL